MKKHLLHAIVAFTCILAVGIGGTICSAEAALLEDVVTEGQTREISLLDDIDLVSDIQYSRARTSHINYGYVELRKESSTRGAILATTQALHVCPEVYLTIYLDWYDPYTDKLAGSREIREFSATNVDHLTKSLSVAVKSGYYYAVRGVHVCIHDDVIESIHTETNGLYIGTTNAPVEPED